MSPHETHPCDGGGRLRLPDHVVLDGIVLTRACDCVVSCDDQHLHVYERNDLYFLLNDRTACTLARAGDEGEPQ